MPGLADHASSMMIYGILVFVVMVFAPMLTQTWWWVVLVGSGALAVGGAFLFYQMSKNPMGMGMGMGMPMGMPMNYQA